MPSIGDAIFLSLFLKLLSIGGGLLSDGDTGWHIITGQNILKTLTIPRADPYSHTMNGAPWVAHEWLADVILALFHSAMGLSGPVLLSAVVLVLTFLLLYSWMLRQTSEALTAAIFTIIAALGSMLHWLARPHIFSLLLTLVFVIILDLYWREGRNRLWLLPLLMVLWVNLHGGYILGLALVLLYAAANLIIRIAAGSESKSLAKPIKPLFTAAFATLAATFVNPRGPAILIFPFHLVGRPFIMDNVIEFRSLDFHHNSLFMLTLLLYLAILVLSPKKPDPIEGSLTFLFVAMSLYSVRYIPLMLIVVSPIVARRVPEVLGIVADRLGAFRVTGDARTMLESISANVTAMESRFNRHVWVWIAVAICFLAGLNGSRTSNDRLFDYRFDQAKFPVSALDFAMRNQIPGNMFNNDGWGGYIIYAAHPRYRVFMDGRSDMYGEPMLRQYLKVSRADLDYEKVLEKYNVTWVLFDADAPICQLLAAGRKWKLVYADTTANILLKDIPENRDLIQTYKDTAFVPRPQQN
jgi:hypothetical protein